MANTDKDLSVPIKKNELINKINKEAGVTVTSFLCDLKIFTDCQYTFDVVKYFYTYIYYLNEKEMEQNIKAYLESYYSNINNNKAKEITNKKNEIKKEEKEIKETKEVKNEIIESNEIKEEIAKGENKEEKINEERKEEIKEN